MRIEIQGLEDERFHRPLQNIANLFFEETEILLSNGEDADLQVEFKWEASDSIFARALLLVKDPAEQYESNHRIDISPDLTDKELFQHVKRAVSYVFVNVLQDMTGINQKWGILTGVRPTKLLHRKVQQGIPAPVAHKQLAEDYMISQEKVELMQKIVDRQLAVVPDLYSLNSEVSIYIGIPFCPTKCAYCTFPAYAINGRQGSVNSFLGGLHYEMREVGKWLKENDINITTIYYGGGTPTSITAEEMDMLYEEMYASFPDVENVREITVEAGRPDTITPEKLEVLKKWNIDRISVNPQSYIQETLKAIGRHHTVQETIDKFHLSRSMGMNNINMDLIIGLPGEELPEFRTTLEETEKLMPESLTVHTLSFKRASEMTRNKQKYKVASREEVEKMMDAAEGWTAAHGYTPYYLYRQKNILGNLENVGYSIAGQESIYNIMIMEEQQTIIGLGCGASSKFVHPVTGKIMQFANPKDPKSYNDNFKHYTHKKIEILDELFKKENFQA
ncbi:coproporphyrinogen III oxidase [Bacillus sp. V5-8f]|uniref:coproporphyrinogen III oxidase n=1 Tax=Bacillus sp. V5-8f TaxID=2053044 RepID=UPI000C77212D|nr:coproporphyrinogen III oxidase [Bacillus sp. V5-8f]PLT33772.1 coproporphyrinogen III oxidase [Bacillus sp. V5-8f]